MDAQQFAYWLQGFAELNEAPPTPEQWKSIREHLATVFVKVTPAYRADLIDPGRAKPGGPHQRPLTGLELTRSECVNRFYGESTC